MLLYIIHTPLSYDFEPIVPNGAKRRQPKRTSDDNPEAIRVSKGTRKRLNGIQTYLPYGRHPHWRHEKRPTKITSQILAVFSPSPFSFWLRGLDLHWKSIGESLCPFSPGLSMNGIGFLTHLVPGRHVLSSPQKRKKKRTFSFYNMYEKSGPGLTRMPVGHYSAKCVLFCLLQFIQMSRGRWTKELRWIYNWNSVF